MSTNIATITGREEIPTGSFGSKENPPKTEYRGSRLSLTRFAGGKENGPMLQLSLGLYPNFGHIQLNAEEITQLKEALDNWRDAPEIFKAELTEADFFDGDESDKFAQ